MSQIQQIMKLINELHCYKTQINVTFKNVMVSNVLGQLIYSYNTTSQINQHDIDTKDWNNGIYFITIISNNQSSTSRILIQH